MSLERQSRIAGPRAIFRIRPYCLACGLLAQVRQSLPTARPNPPRINTSVNSPFFIKSLIMNGLKSNRISQRAHKYPRISTSETCACKPFRINTSKKHPGGRGVSTSAMHQFFRCSPGAALSLDTWPGRLARPNRIASAANSLQPSSSSTGSPARAAFAAAITLSAVSVGMKS